MNPFSFILDSYLKGNSAYQPIRRILDVLLSVSITSFVFERFYFKYQWMDISDYKSILHFFVRGDFAVPLLLFLIIHFVTAITSSVLFSISTSKKSAKWIRQIQDYRVTKKEIRELTNEVNAHMGEMLPFKVHVSWLIELHQHVKETIQPWQLENCRNLIDSLQKKIDSSFVLFMKSIITLAIYFAAVPHFGWGLFVIAAAGLLAILVFLWYSYLALEVLPALILKIDHEVEKHLEKGG